nr:hypothetical protein [Acetobacter persici]
MTGKRDRDVGERLNLPHEDGGSLRYGGAPGNRAIPDLVGVGELPPTRKTASPRKRRIPRKPTPAQIERFEALRARVMGIPESR